MLDLPTCPSRRVAGPGKSAPQDRQGEAVAEADVVAAASVFALDPGLVPELESEGEVDAVVLELDGPDEVGQLDEGGVEGTVVLTVGAGLPDVDDDEVLGVGELLVFGGWVDSDGRTLVTSLITGNGLFGWLTPWSR
jgi:hypothetical protein